MQEKEPTGPPTAERPLDRWWETDPKVTTLLAGTFEGGGAKGVAYLGALRATYEEGCWFGAVAGASAGAITATLIAAGLRIPDLEHESDTAFKTMKPGSGLRALLRLRTSFGALDNSGVRVWLEALLRRQIEGFGVSVDGPVTFAALYEATGIELNVVAADLTRSRQLVFSVWDTPRVQVTEAVLASSAIPLAFGAGHLEVPYGTETYTHTIVDGGVWANFPTFVFGDRSYRKFSKRPVDVEQPYAVGFLLAEATDRETDFTDSRFRSLTDAPPPGEWRRVSLPKAPRSGLRRVLLAAGDVVILAVWVIAQPMLWLGSWLSLGRDRIWRGRWPQLPGSGGRAFALLDDALSSLHGALFAFASIVAIVVGALLFLRGLGDFVFQLLDDIRIDLAFDNFDAIIIDLIQVVIGLIVIVLVVAVTLLTLVLILGNYVLLGPIRQTAFGVARTYVAGPGAPIWTGADDLDNVVRLPIPPGLSTLTFDRTAEGVEDAVQQAITDAAAVTGQRLRDILATPPNAVRLGRVRPQYTLEASQTVVPYPGQPASFFLRVGVLSLALVVAVFGAGWLAPEPDWFRYDVNVRFCAEELTVPDDPCNQPTPEAVFANVLFGPAAAGRPTYATLTVDEQEVARSETIPNPEVGRIVAIDLTQNCGSAGCKVTGNAYVDDKLTFRRTLTIAVNVDVR